MANGNDSTSCVITSWIVAALAGVAIAALLIVLGAWPFISAAFAGVIAAIILGFLLGTFMCSAGTAKADLQAARDGTKGAAATGAAAAAAAGAAGVAVASKAASGAAATASSATAATAAAASKAVDIKPSKPLAGQAELAARKGDWKYEAEAKPAAKAKKPAAKKPAAKKAPAKAAPAKTAAKSSGTKTTSSKPAAKPAAKKAAPKPAAKPAAKKAAPKAAAKPAAAKKAAAPKAAAKATPAAKPARKPVAANGKPTTMKKARKGGADDLKLISGVGPKLEGMLNDMGFWHFDQVAGWRKKEVQWVNDNLEGFKGRIERDNWTAQAKILAKGGETEFSKRSKK